VKDHTGRLIDSARIYMMQIPYDRATLIEAQREVVRANGLGACYLRPIAFHGAEKMGVSPKGATVHVAIAAWPWGAYLGPEAHERGIRVKTSSYARHHVNVTMARAKLAATYANSILATLEAAAGRLRRGAAPRRRRLRRRGRARTLRRAGPVLTQAGAHLGARRHHARHRDPLAGRGYE
jgi:branched-subunit amino acid aminotransferase/4-amino-4-deoxychorismate lyase